MNREDVIRENLQRQVRPHIAGNEQGQQGELACG